jgi:hypothetical protein
MKAPKRATAAVIAVILCIFLATQAHALTFNFSDVSSDDALDLTPTPPSLLTATMDLTLLAGDVLQIDLTNQTADFTISEIYFNYGGSLDIEGSAISGQPSGFGGSLLTDNDPATLFPVPNNNITVNGFGNFNFCLDIDDMTNAGLAAGATGAWTINLGTGSGFNINDFNFLSKIPPGDTQVYAALKFTQGQGELDDSAFGAVVPEPTSLLLLGSGLVGLIGLRKKIK